jgi:hypothetical protein
MATEKHRVEVYGQAGCAANGGSAQDGYEKQTGRVDIPLKTWLLLTIAPRYSDPLWMLICEPQRKVNSKEYASMFRAKYGY